MKYPFNNQRAARAWRLAIIGLGVLVLCSCRSDEPQKASAPVPGAANQGSFTASPSTPSNLPANAPTGAVVPTAYAEPMSQKQPTQPFPQTPGNGPCIMGWPGMENGAPLPYTAAGPWIPPGIVPPWPTDEYLRDGGENPPGVAIGKNGELMGLQMEDTVARYKTLDGRTLVEPSNKVDLYSPRFSAVRQVVDAEIDQQRRRAAGVAEPVKATTPQTDVPVGLATQDLQPIRGIGTNPAGQLRARLVHATHYTELLSRSFESGFRAYENASLVRTGVYLGSDQPILARSSEAANVWKSGEGVHVILDSQAAAAAVAEQKAQLTFGIGSSPNPRLRIVKLASTPVAEPGDEVSFTIRFDNVGDEAIGSVEIIDSLTTRLEYVPNSAQCSLNAHFTTQPNEGDSLVVRCILNDPLPAGKGGVFRFRCIVR